jgi:hypothetical protein
LSLAVIAALIVGKNGIGARKERLSRNCRRMLNKRDAVRKILNNQSTHEGLALAARSVANGRKREQNLSAMAGSAKHQRQ